MNTVAGWREGTCKECNRNFDPVRRFQYFCDPCRKKPTRKDLARNVEWNITVGQWLKPVYYRGLIWEAGNKKGLTYSSIGELANIAGGTLKGWDRGHVPKNLRRVNKLAKVLEKQVYELFVPEVLEQMDWKFGTSFLRQFIQATTNKTTLPSISG